MYGLDSYIKYINNLLKCIEGYKPTMLTTTSSMRDIYDIVSDIDDLIYMDEILKVGSGESLFLKSYDFLNHNIVVKPSDKLKNIIKDGEKVEKTRALLGNLLDDTSNKSSKSSPLNMSCFGDTNGSLLEDIKDSTQGIFSDLEESMFNENIDNDSVESYDYQEYEYEDEDIMSQYDLSYAEEDEDLDIADILASQEDEDLDYSYPEYEEDEDLEGYTYGEDDEELSYEYDTSYMEDEEDDEGLSYEYDMSYMEDEEDDNDIQVEDDSYYVDEEDDEFDIADILASQEDEDNDIDGYDCSYMEDEEDDGSSILDSDFEDSDLEGYDFDDYLNNDEDEDDLEDEDSGGFTLEIEDYPYEEDEDEPVFSQEDISGEYLTPARGTPPPDSDEAKNDRTAELIFKTSDFLEGMPSILSKFGKKATTKIKETYKDMQIDEDFEEN